jgi:hypothetical protein
VKVGAMAVVLQGCCKIAARLTFSVVRTTHTWAPILLLDRNCPIVYIHNVCSCRHLEPSALRSSKNMGSATMWLGEGRGTGRMHRLQDSARSTSPLLHDPISHPIVSFSLCHDQRLDECRLPSGPTLSTFGNDVFNVDATRGHPFQFFELACRNHYWST